MSKTSRRKKTKQSPGPGFSPRQKRADKWSRNGLILIAVLVGLGLIASRACA